MGEKQVYKVVRNVNGILMSAFGNPCRARESRIRYDIGMWTKPHEGCGSLTAFHELADAIDYAKSHNERFKTKSLEIWNALARSGPPIAMVRCLGIVCACWVTQDKCISDISSLNGIMCVLKTIRGATYCKSIKLMSKVELY